VPAGATVGVQIVPARWDDPDVRRLTAGQQAELRGIYQRIEPDEPEQYGVGDTRTSP
jgi:hypothetical protein